MPAKTPKPPLLDPESLAIMRATATALHASVNLTGPQPSGMPRFPQERLMQLFSDVGKYGFESFTILPIGAQFATPPSRQAVVALDRTIVTEQFDLSGSSLRPFSELAAMLFDRVEARLDVNGYRTLQLNLLAFWPLSGVDALQFLAKSVPLKPQVILSLGSGFGVAGLRFHKGKPGDAEEWNLKIEPLLLQPDRLWIEADSIYSMTFHEGKEVATRFELLERFLRDQVRDAVLALAGNKTGGS